jgi:hypothetical protein
MTYGVAFMTSHFGSRWRLAPGSAHARSSCCAFWGFVALGGGIVFFLPSRPREFLGRPPLFML